MTKKYNSFSQNTIIQVQWKKFKKGSRITADQMRLYSQFACIQKKNYLQVPYLGFQQKQSQQVSQQIQMQSQSFLDYVEFVQTNKNGQIVYQFQQQLTFFDFSDFIGCLRSRPVQQHSSLTSYLIQNGPLELLLPQTFNIGLRKQQDDEQQEQQDQPQPQSEETTSRYYQNFNKIVNLINTHIQHLHQLSNVNTKFQYEIDKTISGKFATLWSSWTTQIDPSELKIPNQQTAQFIGDLQAIFITYHDLVGVLDLQMIKPTNPAVVSSLNHDIKQIKSLGKKTQKKPKKGKGTDTDE